MQQYLVFFILLFLSLPGLAKSFSYEATELAIDPPLVELHLLAQPMRSVGYDEIDSLRRGNLPQLGVDQVYVNATWEKAIFLKFGWRTSERKVRERFVKMGDGFSYHLQIHGKMDVALFFLGMGRAEATTLVKHMMVALGAETNKKSASMDFSIFREAHAQTEAGFCYNCLEGASQLSRQIQSIAQPLNLNFLRSSVGTCLSSAWEGAKGSIAGMLDLLNPVKLWRAVRSAFESFKNLVFQFTETMEKAWEAISGLTPDMMRELICSTVGGLAPAAIATALGVGAGRLAIQLAKVPERLANASAMLKRMAGMENLKPETRMSITREVGLCAAR